MIYVFCNNYNIYYIEVSINSVYYCWNVSTFFIKGKAGTTLLSIRIMGSVKKSVTCMLS